VLYEGGRVTGIVDYGSVKTDHVAVDLARLLGSLVGNDAPRRAEGLKGYMKIHALTDEEQELIILLDETGTILGAANWIRWVYLERRQYENREAIANRLAVLVSRLEQASVRA
jgi:Ser/Thr protein kinase RdoA (MazF antagonist)